MKTCTKANDRGLTRLELLAVVATLALLALVVAGLTSGRGQESKRLQCRDNLKNIGLANRIFATDCGGAFPWSLPPEQGGTIEFLADTQAMWRHFGALSNELSSPRILWCPTDVERTPATHYGTNSTGLRFADNRFLSYLVGVQAFEEQPSSILSGDRNVTTNGVPVENCRLTLTTNISVGFSAKLHRFEGNLLLGDGSVQQVGPGRLNARLADAIGGTLGTNDVWLIP